jgi:hypothetical protein
LRNLKLSRRFRHYIVTIINWLIHMELQYQHSFSDVNLRLPVPLTGFYIYF